MKYILYTLVDITETKQHHGPDRLARSQQQNFETVLQTLGLCGNVYYEQSPAVLPASEKFKKSKGNMWKFEWTMEIDELFAEGNNPISKLFSLFEFVPIITGLTETSKIPCMFKVGQNIIFEFQ